MLKNSTKLTYEQIKYSFESEGYVLLSTEYNGCNHYLNFICPNGHEHKIKWPKWQLGQRCGKCHIITYEQVKKSFENEGYQLLSTEYKKSSELLTFICPNGHEHKITWDNWKQGYRCGYCTDRYSITYDHVKKSFEKEDYILLSTEYNNSYEQLEYICPNGHHHKITWNNWRSGRRCGICDGKHFTIEQVRLSFENEGFILLSTEYKNAHHYLKYICPNGHKHKITWNNWNQGARCGKCDIKWSKGEKEITNYIKNNYNYVVKENDRSLIINPITNQYLELDIWMPEINKAIEYNST
jgi:hypothetical protein